MNSELIETLARRYKKPKRDEAKFAADVQLVREVLKFIGGYAVDEFALAAHIATYLREKQQGEFETAAERSEFFDREINRYHVGSQVVTKLAGLYAPLYEVLDHMKMQDELIFDVHDLNFYRQGIMLRPCE